MIDNKSEVAAEAAYLAGLSADVFNKAVESYAPEDALGWAGLRLYVASQPVVCEAMPTTDTEGFLDFTLPYNSHNQAAVEYDEERAVLSHIKVHPAQRRMGIARRLVEATVVTLQDQGASRLEMHDLSRDGVQLNASLIKNGFAGYFYEAGLSAGAEVDPSEVHTRSQQIETENRTRGPMEKLPQLRVAYELAAIDTSGWDRPKMQ